MKCMIWAGMFLCQISLIKPRGRCYCHTHLMSTTMPALGQVVLAGS